MNERKKYQKKQSTALKMGQSWRQHKEKRVLSFWAHLDVEVYPVGNLASLMLMSHSGLRDITPIKDVVDTTDSP